MKLENWSIHSREASPYIAPELIKFYLSGRTYGDERFKDGTQVSTSSIVGKKGNKVLTKSGSEYELGEVNPEYEKIYPNAKERLLKSLEEEK